VVARLDGVRLELADFDLDVSTEIRSPSTGLFGHSGSGKTTLLELIAGLRRPSAGRIYIHGNEVTASSARERRIGYVPQDDALFPHMSVERNIRYGAAGASPVLIEQITTVLEIGSLMTRQVRRLSGGERKRVALARALASNPALLLLDEPLSGVDHALRSRVLVYLVRVRQEFGVPMIYVSHDAEEMEAICDEVLVMERGRVIGRR
jgi:molybdate transport system ATP-binding protein